MSAVAERSAGMAQLRSGCGPFRRRLTSRSDVKRTQCACRSQNRHLLRGGRA